MLLPRFLNSLTHKDPVSCKKERIFMFFPQKTVLRTIILKRVNSRVDYSYQSKHIPTVHLRLKYTLFGKNREVKFSGRSPQEKKEGHEFEVRG